MSFQNLIINSTDVQRSIDFYTKFLEAEVVAQPTPGGAQLDLVTGTLEIRDGVAGDSTWVPDDPAVGVPAHRLQGRPGRSARRTAQER